MGATRHGSKSGWGPGFGPGMATDAMWDAMDQLRASWSRGMGPAVATRMGRGDVRASVLALLAEQPMHGYQIIREIEERTQGRWKPSAGSVYPTLQLLADEGLVTAQLDQDRKIYSLTAVGAEQAAASSDDVPWAHAGERERHPLGAVPKAGVDLAQAVAQAMRVANHSQQEQVVEALDEARRKIYSILAQG